MGALFKVFKSDGITEITNIKSVVFREAVNTGEHLTPGCVSSAGIEVEVFNTQANAVSAGDVVYAYVYDNANNGTLLGKFNCEPKIDTKTSYRFTAYDNALKLEADFSQWLQANQSNFPYTIKQLVQQACTIAGVTLGSSSWPLSSQSVQAFYANGLTCRDILSYAAELAGRFVRCHTDGNIYFDWFAANANSIAPSAGTGVYAYKQDGLTYANYTTTALARVAVHPSGEDDVAYIYPTGVTSGNTLHIKNNLLLTGADASFYNAAAQQVYTAVTAVGSYCPMSVNLFPRENPFRAGDIVSITDAQSVTISAPITGMTISNAAATLVSDGRENYEDTTETAKAITQLASDVVRINKLKVDWADINTAIVNYLTANNVTAQNLTIVDEYGNVLATFDGNGIVLGQNDDVHAELDFNSFSLVDKDGNTYLSIGDMRDANGEASITLSYKANGTNYNLIPSTTSAYFSTVEVTVNGTTVTNYTVSTSQIVFSTAPTAGDEIVIKYKTPKALYHYDLGSRSTGYGMGAYSLAAGRYVAAQGAYSSVSGGNSNVATGNYSAISGGNGNKATGQEASVCGGTENEANGLSSFVGGGIRNKANGPQSSIPGGRQCIANGQNQLVFGAYNSADANKVEIVGNGTADNARSNARTLDWSGNEWIAGALSVGDASKTLDNLKAFDLGVTANAIASGDNLDNYKTVGTYICATNAIANNLNQYGNCPTARAFKMIVMYSISNACLLQIIYDYRGEAMWQRWYNSSWSAWRKYSYDVASSYTVNTTYGGVTQTGGCVVRKRGNVVQCEISHGNGTTFSGLTGIDSICTIPSGYRPTTTIILPIVARDVGTWASANYVTACLRVSSAGAVEIRYNKNVMGTMKYIVGSVTWLTDE